MEQKNGDLTAVPIVDLMDIVAGDSQRHGKPVCMILPNHEKVPGTVYDHHLVRIRPFFLGGMRSIVWDANPFIKNHNRNILSE
jgi:hypothetical protein